jgi:hypothetical protein
LFFYCCVSATRVVVELCVGFVTGDMVGKVLAVGSVVVGAAAVAVSMLLFV